MLSISMAQELRRPSLEIRVDLRTHQFSKAALPNLIESRWLKGTILLGVPMEFLPLTSYPVMMFQTVIQILHVMLRSRQHSVILHLVIPAFLNHRMG